MKIEKNIVILFLLSLPLLACGQKYDYVWMFGYNSNQTSDYPGVEGVIANFTTLPVSFDYQVTNMNIFVSNATISDSLGNFLFYTNGCFIADSNHELMENGDNINPGEVHDTQCEYGYTAGTQSCLILPNPANSNQYYLFHKHIVYEYEPEFDVVTDVLYYSLIDMSLNGGKGSVIQKNIPLIQEPMTFGQLTAVKHANGSDWWVLTAADHSNKYHKLLITGTGINSFDAQEIGMESSQSGSSGGQAVFSADGAKFARYSAPDGLYLFDFNRNSGELSNFQFLGLRKQVVSEGVEFSPSSGYLYASAEDTLFQFDLKITNIVESKQVVGVYDGFQSPFPTTFHNAQLAPDCKIYINTFATVNVLHVIHNPDEPGLACNFEQHAVQLPFNHRRSLPHFPNYRLGPLVEGEDPPPPCEPVVSTEEEALPTRQKAYVFPNPAPGYFKVVFEEALRRPGRVVLYNGLGQAVLEEVLEAGGREFRLEVGGVAPGLYFYSVFLEGEAVKGGKLVVGR